MVDAHGNLRAHYGNLDQPFFLRSSAKPFQAYVAQLAGAKLNRRQLAMAASSHDGEPVHVALVGAMLGEAGLDESSLGCPVSWPLKASARDRLLGSGETGPRRIWHNCSGKHASWLRACLASGWPTETYLDPSHPLQQEIQEFVTELGEYPVEPVGVDGCGAPVLRTTARAMALMFSRLATDPKLHEVANSMHTYPALVSGTDNGDASIATALNAVAKRGADGCIGVAVDGHLGVAVKCWDGSDVVAAQAAVAALEDTGLLTSAQRSSLRPVAEPMVLGGGEPVGVLESRLELSFQ